MNRSARLKLKLQDPAFASLTDIEALDALQTKNIVVQQPISTTMIKAYLMVVDKWRAIADSVLPSAKEAVDAMSLFETFDITDPTYLTTLTRVLDALITDGLLTAPDKTAILGFGEITQSWCEQNNIFGLRVGEITQARI